MNTFRTTSRLLIATVVIFTSNATAGEYLKPLFNSITSLPGNKSATYVVIGGLSVASGIALEKQLAKGNPLVISGVAGAVAGTLEDPLAALASTVISLCISGARAYAPKSIEMAKIVTDKLPECLTSQGAKDAAQVVVSAAAGILVAGQVK